MRSLSTRAVGSLSSRLATLSAVRGVGCASTRCLAAASSSSSTLPVMQRRFNSTTAKEPEEEDIVVEPVPEKTAAPKDVETEAHMVGQTEEMGFKTETRQLLDIVACSLYTDKEVFVRELVSNASDALEKRRHYELKDPENYPRPADEEPPTVSLIVNQSKSRFVIKDNGIGMTHQELMDNLGTIASSGSKAFVRQLQEQGGQAADKIIGQFGVGFYSSFMVARYVRVYSRSAKKGSKGYVWESDGTGTFKITEVEGVPIGTKIVLDVKDTELSFCTPQVVERVIKKYSNFIEFEITLNGGKINTVEALWMKSRDEITEEEHIDFYKFVSGAYDSPLSRLHYIVDAPISIRALLYTPQSHTEKYGGGRMESGVNLYCRRVLIQSKAKGVLPEWLRFVKGAVDSESLPLNISREHTQDGSIMRRLNTVLTKRILKWFDEDSRKDRAKYEKFIKEYGGFLKEGVCTDQINKMDIAKLLRFESTKSDASYPLISLDEYRDRMLPNQTNIYYLSAPSKQLALNSPYYEAFKEHDLEVLVLTEPIDDFVMQHLETYAKHKLQNIETYDAALDGAVTHKKKIAESDPAKKDETKDVSIKRELSETQVKEFSDFISKRLVGRVGIVKSTTRLRDSPAVIADHESAQMRKLYRITGQYQGPEPKYNFHFNPQHEIVRKCFTLSQSSSTQDVETAGLIVEQLFDNAVISAGLLDDARSIVNRLNNILTRMVESVPEPGAKE